MIRVLLVDDQAMIRGGLRMILEIQPDIEVVGEAGDGAEAVSLARTTNPDVVLMDIRMPGIDGIDATRRVLQSPTPPHVLILTTFDTDEYVYRALQAGASGFLLKAAPPARLVEAVRVVADGDALLAPTITRRLIEEHLRTAVKRLHTQNVVDALTVREREVLALVARGLTNAEIAGQLVLGESTVKTHVNSLLRKLAARDRVQLVICAYENGLVEPNPPD